MRNHVYGGTNFPFVYPFGIRTTRALLVILLSLAVLSVGGLIGGLTALVWWLI